MLQSISPYELLRESKPKPAPVVVTRYDLFSQAQQRAQAAPAAAEDSPLPPAAMDASAASGQPGTPPLPPRPAQRTHYIADIHARHSAASRRTPLRT